MGLMCVASGVGWASTPIVYRQLSTLDNSKGTGPDAINLQVVRFPW